MPPYAYRAHYRISHGSTRAVPRKPAIHHEMSACKTRHAMKSERNNRPWLLAAAPACSRPKIAIQKKARMRMRAFRKSQAPIGPLSVDAAIFSCDWPTSSDSISGDASHDLPPDSSPARAARRPRWSHSRSNLPQKPQRKCPEPSKLPHSRQPARPKQQSPRPQRPSRAAAGGSGTSAPPCRRISVATWHSASRASSK